MYRIKGYFQSSEEDSYADGCIPSSGFSGYNKDINIQAETVSGIIEEVKKSFSVTDDALDLTFNEPERFDMQRIETADGDLASDSDIAKWKKGKKRLWLCNYSFYVEECHPVSLVEVLERERKGRIRNDNL